MLDLRATYLNGDWNAFWEYHVEPRRSAALWQNCGKRDEATPVVTPYLEAHASAGLALSEQACERMTA